MLSNLMKNINTLNLKNYEALEQQYSKEEIWKILQWIENNSDWIQKSFSKDTLVGKTRVPIDAAEEIDWEWGFREARLEEVSNFIKKCYPQAEKLLRSWLLEVKRFSIGKEEKRADFDPFIDGGIISIYLQDHRVAILFSARTELNHAEIDFVIYPKLILQLLEKEKKVNQ